MKISFWNNILSRDISMGYGNAGYNMVSSLERLGHKVSLDDETAPVQFSFCGANDYKFYDSQYKIGYTPWESTELPHGWAESMNACDEIWTTSEWNRRIFQKYVDKEVKLYEHGLNPMWKPVERKQRDVVKFLHVGEPALRKGGQMAVDAFRAAFGDRTDVHLTVKAYFQHNILIWENGHVFGPGHYNNVTVIKDNLYENELLDLYADHDVMVYPSYGEGFGLMPLQALGTGMPVICTHEWAPYKDFLGSLALDSRYERTVWGLHPGNLCFPDYDMLVDLYTHAFDNIEVLRAKFEAQAPEVHKAYNWDVNTERAFRHIVEKFG